MSSRSRQYLDANDIKAITDHDLVDMLTVNAAKALNMEEQGRCVAEGCIADMVLIDVKARAQDP